MLTNCGTNLYAFYHKKDVKESLLKQFDTEDGTCVKDHSMVFEIRVGVGLIFLLCNGFVF